ncbi:DUF4328 domain-containing protein [Streptomyces sp. NPDC101149]|uniref:DUF4328 domain-containing protein n=1 Tax=Streptomyces sp. NPDC101149 TaxID=3366113 RepID=UPI00381F0299
MICARCQHFEVAPGGTLCTRCAVAPEPEAPQFTAAPVAWLRSPVGLGRTAATLLGLVVVLDLFAFWAAMVVYDVAGDLANGGASGVGERAERADSLYSSVGLLQTSVLLTCVVVFLCWFHRVRVNAEVFSPFGHAKKRGWAIGAWFVPIVNLWFPRRITLDIWDASSPWDTPRSHGLVDAWWTLWLLSVLTNRSGSFAYRSADTAEEIRGAVRQVLVADVVDAAAAVLAILVVLRLTRMQHEKALRGPATVAF